MIKRNKYGWLQLFGGNEPEAEEPEAEEEEDLVEGDEEPEQPEGTEQPEGEEPEADDEPEEKLLRQSDVDKIVQKRLERDRRSRPATESLTDKAEVPDLSEGEQVQALRLWTLLKHNPEVSREVDKVLAATPATLPMYIKANKQAQTQAKPSEGDRYEALETRLELRADPLFKKHEKAIMDYADAEDIDTATAKGLKLAFKAWKGEKAPLLAANASLKADKGKGKEAAAAAKGIARKGGAKPVSIDYKKASIGEIMAADGLNLFEDD